MCKFSGIRDKQQQRRSTFYEDCCVNLWSLFLGVLNLTQYPRVSWLFSTTFWERRYFYKLGNINYGVFTTRMKLTQILTNKSFFFLIKQVIFLFCVWGLQFLVFFRQFIFFSSLQLKECISVSLMTFFFSDEKNLKLFNFIDFFFQQWTSADIFFCLLLWMLKLRTAPPLQDLKHTNFFLTLHVGPCTCLPLFEKKALTGRMKSLTRLFLTILPFCKLGRKSFWSSKNRTHIMMMRSGQDIHKSGK